MNIWYIDNDSVAGFNFYDIVKRSLPGVNCSLFTEGKIVIVQLLQVDVLPQLLFVTSQLQGLKCKNLLEFLKKDQRFENIKVVVLSQYFSKAEMKEFNDLNVHKCISRLNEEKLTELMESFILSD